MNKILFSLCIYCALMPLKINAQQQLSPIEKATIQYNYAFEEIAKSTIKEPKKVSPRTTRGDTLIMVPSKDWTSGFFAGNLWQMYELTQDKKWLRKAQEFTAPIEQEKTNGTTHDMGFKVFCSFGNGYRLAGTPQYKAVLIESARTLTTRFNEKTGCLRSWDHHSEVWDFPVIIDNMMNLELLFWAFKETQDSTFYKITVSHANTTMKNHFRPDFSSYHVIGYDPKTGEVKHRNTHQGYSDASAWARGQSWGLYSFAMCYRETGDKKYLQHAENIANYILKNPTLPKDLVPYWDYNAPNIPNEPRDVSAATIMASAFYELSELVPQKATFYRQKADTIMRNIAEKYTAPTKTNKGFLLTNSTGHFPNNSEINVPIIYADYYYLEALLKQKKYTILAQNAPQTIVLNGGNLIKNQQAIANKEATKTAALKSLLMEADKLIKKGKVYSVMNKKIVPPSGNKHDYISQAPYWWADSSKPNGLPYIRRDGERNPELNKISDHNEMGNLEDEVETLAFAYFFTKDERYAKHAARLIKTWFLDEKTRQTPHLNFGQGIPGINTGRGIGIIETRGIYRIADAAILLRGSKSWVKKDHNGLKKWFSDYLTWLRDSPIGKDEADEHNNHGTHYDAQIISLALFTEQMDIAKSQLEETKKRIKSQLKPDGSQPFELERTTSWSYVNMNLGAFFTIARLAENLNIDMWHFETTDGKSIQKCVDWLVPFLKNEKKWAHKQIKKIDYEHTIDILKMAAKAYGNPTYDALAKQVDAEQYNDYLHQLGY
jgi:unsaturated chondroitin disaccharide hydrolase